jgi:hypothetical protein
MVHASSLRLFVYALCEPDGSVIRYVGITNNLWKRFSCHFNRSSNRGVRRWIRELRSRGLVPSMIVLREVFGTAAGLAAEAEEIASRSKTGQLLNDRKASTDKGDGSISLTVAELKEIGITVMDQTADRRNGSLSHQERSERRRRIAEAVASGSLTSEVAKEFGVTVATVNLAIREYGISCDGKMPEKNLFDDF